MTLSHWDPFTDPTDQVRKPSLPWIKPKSTIGKPSRKRWQRVETPKAGSISARKPLLMGSRTRCQTSLNWCPSRLDLKRWSVGLTGYGLRKAGFSNLIGGVSEWVPMGHCHSLSGLPLHLWGWRVFRALADSSISLANCANWDLRIDLVSDDTFDMWKMAWCD